MVGGRSQEVEPGVVDQPSRSVEEDEKSRTICYIIVSDRCALSFVVACDSPDGPEPGIRQLCARSHRWPRNISRTVL